MPDMWEREPYANSIAELNSLTELNSLAQLNALIVNCTKCPRLVTYREQIARDKKRMYRGEDYWGKPVPGWGDLKARVYIVGLAPAAHGGNRTGRVFTEHSSVTLGACSRRTKKPKSEIPCSFTPVLGMDRRG